MGQGLAKCPEADIKFLKEKTKWTRDEIQWRFKNFIVQCPEGTLDMDELNRQCKIMFRGSRPEEFTKHLMRSLDEDKDGCLSFKEYMLGTYIWCKGSMPQKLEWAFKLFDVHGRNKLYKYEVLEVLQAACKLLGGRVDEGYDPVKQVDEVFAKMDVARDGTVTKEDFFENGDSLANLVTFQLPATTTSDKDARKIEKAEARRKAREFKRDSKVKLKRI